MPKLLIRYNDFVHSACNRNFAVIYLCVVVFILSNITEFKVTFFVKVDGTIFFCVVCLNSKEYCCRKFIGCSLF